MTQAEAGVWSALSGRAMWLWAQESGLTINPPSGTSLRESVSGCLGSHDTCEKVVATGACPKPSRGSLIQLLGAEGVARWA